MGAGRPASAGLSQTCCPPIHRFPDGGTTRSTSTASRSPENEEAAGRDGFDKGTLAATLIGLKRARASMPDPQQA